MVDRQFWRNRIETAWERRSIVWLSGVRRVGKTCLCQTLPNIEYFDCELPRVRRLMEDPQEFLDSVGDGRIVLDEVHRLPNPDVDRSFTSNYNGIQVKFVNYPSLKTWAC